MTSVAAAREHKLDSLALGVVRFTSWALIIGGILLAISLATVPATPAARIVLNLLASLIGVLALELLRRHRPSLAAALLVGAMWGLITVTAWRNGGNHAPNLLSYIVLIVTSAWLLGGRATVGIVGITGGALLAFYVAETNQRLPPPASSSAEVHLLFLAFVFAVVTWLTLLSRRSYRQQLADLEQKNRDIAARDVEVHKLSRVVEQSPESIIITNLEQRIEYVNEAFVTHTGFSRTEAIGQTPSMLRSGKTPESVFEDLRATLARGFAWRGEFVNRTKAGTEIIESAIVTPIRNADGVLTHYVAIQQDITQLRRSESEIHRLANFDPLTGLPNRTLLLQRISRRLALARRRKRQFALLLFDIDRFKMLNDARGQAFGDAFLGAVALRLAPLLRERDTLARLAADEFAILLQDLGDDPERAAPRALAVVEKIQADMRCPFHVGGSDDILASASLGVALCPNDDNDTPQDILRRAETALHRAKAAGGGRCAFFDAAMGEAAEQRYLVERELRQGIGTGELRLFLQPQVDAGGHRTGAEVLVRWQHPVRGLVPPITFIPIAEESDLIVDLGDWVMREACRLIAAEDAAGRALDLSVNVSPRHFHRENFVSWLTEVLRATGADPTRLTLEVTEGLVITDIADVVVKMNTLADLGLRFSIDDFGTGYSSLAYLKRLPIHELKIDRTFIKDIATDTDDAVLVETILSIARHMQLTVVAEGVETAEQAAFLNARGPIIHQGYLFGRPEAASVWLARWRGDADAR